MTFQNHTTAIATNATEAAPLQSITIDLTRLRSLSMADLNHLHEAVMTIQETAIGVAGWHRFAPDYSAAPGFDGATPTGSVISQLTDALAMFREEIESVLDAAQPQDLAEIKHKTWALLRCQVEMADSLESVAAMSTEALRRVDAARRRERGDE